MRQPEQQVFGQTIVEAYRRFRGEPDLRSDIPLPALPFELSSELIRQLSSYIELLLRWNETVDLIAPADVEQMVDRHILDSLAFSLLLLPPSGRILDIGTGAGLPGVVAAAARPDLSVALCEPRKKRCVFLREVKRALGLKNVEVFEGKLEELAASDFSLLTCRALGEDRLVLDSAEKLLAPSGRAALMVGPSWCRPGGERPGLYWRGTVDYVLPLDLARRSIAVWDVSRETNLN